MINKKGVTDIILAIGIVIAMVVVLFIGVNTFSIIARNEPEFIAKELALTGDAVLAAPEGVLVQYNPPAPKLIAGLVFQVRKAILFLGQINFKDGVATGYKYSFDIREALAASGSPFGLLALSSYNCDGQQCTFKAGGATISQSSQKFYKDKSSSMAISDYGKTYELTIIKSYNNTVGAGTYKIRVNGR